MSFPAFASEEDVEALSSGIRVSAVLDRVQGIAHLVITRAEEHNAIDPAFVADLRAAALAVAAAGDQVRVLLIRAEGPDFTVGGDLHHFQGHLHRLAAELESMVEPFHEALTVIAELPVPVVCAVNGAAAGGGLGILWCADIIVASENAKFITAFSKLGVSGDGGSSWYLPRMVGQVRALELMLESPLLDAKAALAYGLVTRVVPDDALSHEAEQTALRLAHGPVFSMGIQRRLVRQAMGRTLAAGFAAELDAMNQSGDTADAAEGMKAFIVRRQPVFGGASGAHSDGSSEIVTGGER